MTKKCPLCRRGFQFVKGVTSEAFRLFFSRLSAVVCRGLQFARQER